MEIGMNKEYYIATAADKIFLPPSGDIYINGLAAEAMFYKGSLDKLGVEVDAIQIGPKYKSAPDQYTKTTMGDGQREVINAVVDEYFTRFTSGIAESRKKSVEDVKALIDGAPYNAKQAKELGLIDEAFYREQVDAELKTKLGYKDSDKLRVVRGGEYREIPSDSLGLNNGEKVAVIYASGAITSGRSSNGVLNGETVGSDTIVAAVNDAAKDPSVKAIVLRVDSGGGSAPGPAPPGRARGPGPKPGPPPGGGGGGGGGPPRRPPGGGERGGGAGPTITGSIGIFVLKPNIKGFSDGRRLSSTRCGNAGHLPGRRKWDAEESQDGSPDRQRLLRQLHPKGRQRPQQNQRGSQRSWRRPRLDRHAG
ncbi:MAG: S49 family peptidase [Acidobacteria bacterium]|nr:S49 family peptidase [Acidobacteriota bacterium]